MSNPPSSTEPEVTVPAPTGTRMVSEWLHRLGRFATRHSVTLVATVLTVLALGYALGGHVAWLAVAGAVLAGFGWLLRRRPAVLASAAAAVMASLAAMWASLIGLIAAPAASASLVAVGFAVAAPTPILLTWSLRPALPRRVLTSWMAAGVELLGIAALAIWPSQVPAFAVFAVTLFAANTLVWWRWRRGRAHVGIDDEAGRPVEITDRWWDYQARALPDGTNVDRMVVGPGMIVAAWHTPQEQDNHENLTELAVRGHAIARALGVPAQQVQPVALNPATTQTSKFAIDHDQSGGIVACVSHEGLPAFLATAPAGKNRRRLHTCVAALTPARSSCAA